MESEIVLVLLVLAAAIVLFVTELVRVDVVALIVLTSLAWLGLVTPVQAFSGFGSNAVIAIIAVMILAHGIDRTGIMIRLSRYIIRIAGESERRLLVTVSLATGGLSSFIQSVGAAALFLPALMRISRRTKISASRLVMPVGFAAILGGTLTMVGSGPLIVLNDLLGQRDLLPFGLFAVTPIGIILLGASVVYFFFFGSLVLPDRRGEEVMTPQEELIETWQIPATVFYYRIRPISTIVGMTPEEVGVVPTYNLHLLAIAEGNDIVPAPWRYTRFIAGQELALLGMREDVERFADTFGLDEVQGRGRSADAISSAHAGFAEVVVRPRAAVVGRTIREIAFRKNYGVEPILLISGTEERRTHFSARPLSPGDTIIVHGRWDRIRNLESGDNFLLVTRVEGEEIRESKAIIAALCFIGAIALALSGMVISLALFSGAIAMVLLGVISIDEAYGAVDWRTVFLLAGLIPLGIAMEQTGTAAFLADQLLQLLEGSPVLLILIAVSGLTAMLSLFMSNVAATVLLVPLILIIAPNMGIDPRSLALLVAVSAQNSFVLPTHQINALFMKPGGYRNSDYIRAGGIMTVLFILIASGSVYLFYL